MKMTIVRALVDLNIKVITTPANEDVIATYTKRYRQGMMSEVELFTRIAELFAKEEESK
jgi:hypothetical protein